jgi:predicted NBD/HSP70 family sugar kinase
VQKNGTVQVHTATPSSVRDVNRSIILNMIRLHHPISRAELSDRSGIFRSNVSGIVDELIGLGLVKEERAAPVGRGRVPFHLSLNDEGFRVLGVSIRPAHTTVAYAGLAGCIRKRIDLPTPKQPRVLVESVIDAIKHIRGELPAGGAAFEDICVSVPGLADVLNGNVQWIPALPAYTGFPIRAALEEATGIPVSIDNDCNLAALAELWLSDRENMPLSNVVFIEVGTVGVGGGIIIQHDLYRGRDSTFAGEYGHMAIDLNGPKCSCGRRGCWELYISDRATWQRWKPSVRFDPDRFGELMEAARQRDRKALDAIDESARILAVGVSNIVFALNPDLIIVAGRITEVWDLIEAPVKRTFEAARITVPLRRARMDADELPLHGAVTLAVSKAFAKPKFGL